jgi:zinc transport system ATP-binding protein
MRMPRDPADGALIAARGLSVTLGGHRVVDGVDLSVGQGEIVVLIGPNGSGKTTLVRAILDLLEPDAGTVERRIGLVVGYVPQHLQIDPTLPMTVRRFLSLRTRATAKDLAAALAEVGVAQVLDQPVQSLSGGQTRRMLLARALLRDPDLLVLDEPTAGVDVAGQAALYDLVRQIRDRRGCGVLLVSHHLHLVMAAADRVICLNHHVCCEGQPAAVSRNPALLEMFGPEAAAALGVYSHQHDHRHDLSGAPVASQPEETAPRESSTARHG